MSTNIYKRFDPRVMEREERIGINRGLPTMVLKMRIDLASLCEFSIVEENGGTGENHRPDLRQVGGFLCVLQFPPPIKRTATI
jgi:hypothetical protein